MLQGLKAGYPKHVCALDLGRFLSFNKFHIYTNICTSAPPFSFCDVQNFIPLFNVLDSIDNQEMQLCKKFAISIPYSQLSTLLVLNA